MRALTRASKIISPGQILTLAETLSRALQLRRRPHFSRQRLVGLKVIGTAWSSKRYLNIELLRARALVDIALQAD
jgi:hypothetical protein